MKLVITEKPSVARAYASALEIGTGGGKNGYYAGNGYIISWCIGHLISLSDASAYDKKYEKWNVSDLPVIPSRFLYEIKKNTRPQYAVLKKLMTDPDISSVVCATDAGREGESIFRLVYEKAGCKKPIERLWISSMEDEAIRQGFRSLRPGSEFDALYRAALCRMYGDWLVGINATRLFSCLYNKTLRIGRVVAPTVGLVVERDLEIKNFKPKPYFLVHLNADGIDCVSERYEDRQQALDICELCDGSDAVVTSIETEEKRINPPKLYDLTSLQRDANKFFGFTAQKTLDYTQSLYDKKILTYPRTDSRFLTEDMSDTADRLISIILSMFGSVYPAYTKEPNIRRIMNNKKVSDHHAIIPTGEIEKTDIGSLPDGEKKILMLVVTRLLSATAPAHVYEATKAIFTSKGYEFKATGRKVTDPGFKAFDEAMRKHLRADREEKKEEDNEQNLTGIEEGSVFKHVPASVTDHETKPPKHYTEDTLLRAMERAGASEMDDDVERKGLGTTATRAETIEKMFQTGYCIRQKKQILATDAGFMLIDILPDYLTSAAMTAEWENELNRIAKGTGDPDAFLTGIKETVKKLVFEYKDKRVSTDAFTKEREVLGKCPNCGGEVLTGDYGAYCREKCGMSLSRLMGKKLTDKQVKSLLCGNKILLKNLKSSKGKTYDAYFTPNGIEPYSFTGKDGKEIKGMRFCFDMDFPKRT